MRRSEISLHVPAVITTLIIAATMAVSPAHAILINGESTVEDGSAPMQSAGEPAVDILGDSTNSSTTASGKGNIIRIDTERKLVEQEFYMSFQGDRTLSFYVYESPTENGTYTQIQTNSILAPGVGESWYSSGPIDVDLEAGTYYLLGFSWDPSLIYFFGAGDSQLISFGEHLKAYASGTHPLGPTIEIGGNDHAIYHQRLTTVPEPCTALILGLGALALRRTRHRP